VTLYLQSPQKHCLSSTFARTTADGSRMKTFCQRTDCESTSKKMFFIFREPARIFMSACGSRWLLHHIEDVQQTKAKALAVADAIAHGGSELPRVFHSQHADGENR